jgi:hypothetical protein
MLAVALAPDWVTTELPDFTARVRWLQKRRPELLSSLVASHGPSGAHLTLALVDPPRFVRLLTRMLDEGEFLSPYGIRSLSASYREPFTADVEGHAMTIRYEPAESDSALFGGNSNWRGPVWFPVNVLLADAIGTYGRGVLAEQTVLDATGTQRSLQQIAAELDDRLIALFRPDATGRRPSQPRDYGSGVLWDQHVTFSEYFHGDTGAGLGASHQTGWTALVAHLICRAGHDGFDE